MNREHLLACLLLTGISMPAQAITYTTNAEVETRKTGSDKWTGVGTVNMIYRSNTDIKQSGTCTGTLLSSNVVITAAHCFDGMTDPVVAVVFDLPSYAERNNGQSFTAIVDSWTVHPDYTEYGGPLGYDVALFTLSEAAVGYETYEIYQGDPIGEEFTRVGTGRTGGPAGSRTGYVTARLDRREGNNVYEYHGDVEKDGEQVIYNAGANTLMSDFDDGTDTHDVFGRVFGTSQTGIEGESGSAQGDSGGPTFIDGQIAGITSFGNSGSILDETYCAEPGAIDPYIGAGGACSNSSVGEYFGDTWVKPYTQWIEDYVSAAAVVPEPSTWLTMIFGFAGVGVELRRRPRRPARHAMR